MGNLEGQPVIVVYVVGANVLRRRGSPHTRGDEVRETGLRIGLSLRSVQEGGASVDVQATYAFASARVNLRLNELRAALERHEADPANWARFEILDRIEGTLGELVEEVENL
jgi:hypothetical protein